MPNRARQRGDYFERRTQDAFQHEGWWVIRAAGSLGVADLVALRRGYTPRMISCKLTHHMPRKQRVELCEAAELAGAHPMLAWSAKPGWVGLEVLTIHGPVIHLPMLHMPPARKRGAPPAVTDGLYPAGQQLTLDL